MFVIRFIFIATIFITPFFAFGQEDYSTYSKGELKVLARSAERINDIESAAEYYEAYLDKKPKDLKVVEHH